MTDAQPFDPDWVMCPGSMLEDFIKVGSLPSHDEVRSWLGINVEEYAQLLRGELWLGDDMADVLGERCGMSHGQENSFWRNCERIYRDGLARGKTHVCHPDVTS